MKCNLVKIYRLRTSVYKSLENQVSENISKAKLLGQKCFFTKVLVLLITIPIKVCGFAYLSYILMLYLLPLQQTQMMMRFYTSELLCF